MGFEEELKEAVTTVVRKHPDIDYLKIYNTLQGVSYSVLAEFEEECRLKKEQQYLEKSEGGV